MSNINVIFNERYFDNFEKREEIMARMKFIRAAKLGAMPWCQQPNTVLYGSRAHVSRNILLLFTLPPVQVSQTQSIICICRGRNVVFTVITWCYYTAPIWAPCTAAIHPSLAHNPAIPGMNRRSGSPRIRFGQIDTDAILARHWLITPVFPAVLTIYVINLSGKI